MKTIIISLFGIAALAFTSCTTVEQTDPSTRSSTTTTGVAPTIYGSSQTTTTRTY